MRALDFISDGSRIRGGSQQDSSPCFPCRILVFAAAERIKQKKRCATTIIYVLIAGTNIVYVRCAPADRSKGSSRIQYAKSSDPYKTIRAGDRRPARNG